MQRLWQIFIRVFNALSAARRLAFIAAIFFVACLLTLVTAHRTKHTLPAMQTEKMTSPESYVTDPRLPADSPDALEEGAMRTRQGDTVAGVKTSSLAPSYDALRSEPRIAYSADLGVITKDFVHARSFMEDILDRHRGYAARLRMVGNPAGSSLSATLKVPASEYSSTLTDLKSIGDVQTDDESADEVVQQHGDLEARLQNAKNNARRLEQLLKENSDKSIDADYVQRQLVALRAEIARLELERHNIDTRVTFSNIHFSLREVRETPAESVSAQIRKAASSGLTDLIGSLSTLAIFLVGYGPSFALWAAILFFPARYLWRRFRVPLAVSQANLQN
jgi:Domain of unknown function (DUF4349)